MKLDCLIVGRTQPIQDNFASLSAPIHLEELRVQFTEVAHITVLRNMKLLQTLELSGNEIEDISALAELKQL